MDLSDTSGDREVWAVWEAARWLLPPGLSPAFAQGMTGEVWRTRTEPPTFTDLTHLLLPGLAALGIYAEIRPLPEEDAAARRALRERLRYDIPVPALAFDGDVTLRAFPQNLERLLAGHDARTPQEEPPDPRLSRQGVVTAVETAAERRIVWYDAADRETQTPVEAFRADFALLLRLRRVQRHGTRSARNRAALMRGLAFTAARPERLPTLSETDAPVRAQAAAFLSEVVGKRRDPVAVRLRRAATHFEQARTPAEWQAGLLSLREALLLDLHLPAVVQTALLSPAETPLSDIERRELIYLARAGTRDIRILAARRLGSERHHQDACNTLHQLRYDADPWVRASAHASL